MAGRPRRCAPISTRWLRRSTAHRSLSHPSRSCSPRSGHACSSWPPSAPMVRTPPCPRRAHALRLPASRPRAVPRRRAGGRAHDRPGRGAPDRARHREELPCSAQLREQSSALGLGRCGPLVAVERMRALHNEASAHPAACLRALGAGRLECRRRAGGTGSRGHPLRHGRFTDRRSSRGDRPGRLRGDAQVTPKVYEALHIARAMEQADRFDLLHNHFDFLPLAWSRLIRTPLLTTIHGFSSPAILPVYREYDRHAFLRVDQ